jgi:tetratricopeptide (TPR) repeat protein
MADSPRIEELKRRVQMDPASIAFAALAEEYRRTGRYDDAIEVCRTGLQRHASYTSAHVTLGRALMEVGRYDEARQELEYVLTVAPENLAAIRGLAEIHDRQKQSSDHADYTASQMADLLAPRQPLPVRVETVEAPRTAEKPEASETPHTPGRSEEAETSGKPEMVEVVRTIDLEPLVETAPTVPAKPIVAPAPAARAPAAVPEPPKADPALERLDALLQAILRARRAAGRTNVA